MRYINIKNHSYVISFIPLIGMYHLWHEKSYLLKKIEIYKKYIDSK
jgi:hypothetical protein